MTKEKAKRVKILLDDEKWCDGVIDTIHKATCIKFIFYEDSVCKDEWLPDCTYKCPKWLRSIILDEVEKHREAVRKEFSEL